MIEAAGKKYFGPAGNGTGGGRGIWEFPAVARVVVAACGGFVGPAFLFEA